MEMEIEIGVRVNCSYNQLHQELINQGFEIKEEYDVNDNYMIDSNIDITNMNKLDILKKCALVRDIVGITKELVYKYKRYDENNNIIEQGKIKCPVLDIEKAINFMKAINYKELIHVYDHCIVYANEDTQLVVQLVNDKYIFIEMESEGEFINKKYNSTEELINKINSYKISFNKDNYFIKKAELILTDKLNK